ncbi:hypothetical protein RHGRI_021877 [Rhododendron griersonianum]|uniref:Uncharacterized protein n=1 Tax=Rhododendron griersonianum TaxID=479676 RepID=A0AAV6JLS0_9ERIC|nr:hypothetical protein RHGRI_021877 [Rhododendron griersonianum]
MKPSPFPSAALIPRPAFQSENQALVERIASWSSSLLIRPSASRSNCFTHSLNWPMAISLFPSKWSTLGTAL